MGVDHGAVRLPKNLEFIDGVDALPTTRYWDSAYL
jgi:hypothetical protein